MKLIFYLPSFLLFCALPASPGLLAQCSNRILDFDGQDDYVQANSPLSGAVDFTLELWYKSGNTSNTGVCDDISLADFRWLVSWDDDQFGLGDCNGVLQLVYQPVCPSATNLCTTLPTININDGQWHHIAIVQDAANSMLHIYSDCNLLSTINPGNYDLSGFFRLGSSGTGTLGLPWEGQVDEFRLWSTVRSQTDILDRCKCPLSGDEAGLVTYWNMDQGTSGADNSAITALDDESNSSNDGSFQNFSLGMPAGPSSNFFNGNTPLISPYVGIIDLEIKDYPLISTLKTEICDGDPVHFCLLCDGQVPGVSDFTAVVWEYNDGAGWQDVNDPHFTGYCFVVPEAVILASCASNPNGFVDRKYRARFTGSDMNNSINCNLYSKEYSLRICCPLSAATVELSTDQTNNWLCEGDNVAFEVTLNSSDLFVQTPGPATTIEWFYNNQTIGFNNQLTATHNATVDAATGACFTAEVKHCGLKTASYTTCLTVDKTPVCGLIEGVTVPSPLIPDPSDPDPLDDDLYYLICPGSDAVLGKVDPAGFIDCTPVWQYSFDLTTWIDLGSTNDLQNTNILPSYYWSGQTVIYYRIIGLPKQWPNTGCDPDYSNLITIHLQSSPNSGNLVGVSPICDGNQTTLSYDQHQPGYNYQWYCNGLPVGTNSDQFAASKTACYWAEVDNGCKEIYETPKFCLDVCKVKAVFSCPLPPNTGACKGEPVILSGCDSFDNCSGSLSYSFTASNGSAPAVSLANICEMTHTPALTGTTYTLTVSNIDTGCSNTTSVTIVPCDPN